MKETRPWKVPGGRERLIKKINKMPVEAFKHRGRWYLDLVGWEEDWLNQQARWNHSTKTKSEALAGREKLAEEIADMVLNNEIYWHKQCGGLALYLLGSVDPTAEILWWERIVPGLT